MDVLDPKPSVGGGGAGRGGGGFREAAEQIHARLTEVANVIAQDEPLRKLLQEEQTWLARAEDLVRQVRQFREAETSRFWPAMWRRRLAAAAFAFGAGNVWASRPYETELANLRPDRVHGVFRSRE